MGRRYEVREVLEALGDFSVGVDVKSAGEHGLATVQAAFWLLFGQFDWNLSAAPVATQVEDNWSSEGKVNGLHVVLLAHDLALFHNAAGLHYLGEDEQVSGVDVA